MKGQNINQRFNLQKTHHTSPWRACENFGENWPYYNGTTLYYCISSRLSVLGILVKGLRPLPCEFPTAPNIFWRVPPLKYITNFSILGVHWGPGKIFQGPRTPKFWGPESPVDSKCITDNMWVQVMAWGCPIRNHHLNRWWPWSLIPHCAPYGECHGTQPLQNWLFA